MADYLITDTTLTSIANAIREKTGSSQLLKPEDMDDTIKNIATLADGSIDATATAGDIISGKTAYVKGVKITGNIDNQPAQTITPGTTDKTIASGKYLSGTQTIKGDANLIPGNILSGKSIFGIAGNATANSMILTGTVTTKDEESLTLPLNVLAKNNIIIMLASDSGYTYIQSSNYYSPNVYLLIKQNDKWYTGRFQPQSSTSKCKVAYSESSFQNTTSYPSNFWNDLYINTVTGEILSNTYLVPSANYIYFAW